MNAADTFRPALLLSTPVVALQFALQVRALTPRAARLAETVCDLDRALGRGGFGHEADMLTHRICRELWG